MSTLTAENLRENKCGLFAERETTKEAMDYAVEMLRASQVPDVFIYTALGVYSNTLLETIAKRLEE